MNRFIIKALIFSFLFIAIFGAVAFVDPFQRFDLFNFSNEWIKKSHSQHINSPLWKIIEYRKSPIENLILGDSRALGLKPEYIESVTGRKFYNFSYGGATMEEMSSTFWIASRMCVLKSVSFVVSLNSFNLNNSRNRVPGAFATADNPLMYLVNRDVIKATYLVLNSSVKKKVGIGRAAKNKEKYWKYILDVVVKRYYLNFKYDDRKINELKRIAGFCQKNDIKLLFIIPFTHMDVHQRMEKFVGNEIKQRFLTDLSEIANVYDFDYPNDICQDNKKFRDPYHFVEEISNLLIDEVWGGRIRYARTLKTS